MKSFLLFANSYLEFIIKTFTTDQVIVASSSVFHFSVMSNGFELV